MLMSGQNIDKSRLSKAVHDQHGGVFLAGPVK